MSIPNSLFDRQEERAKIKADIEAGLPKSSLVGKTVYVEVRGQNLTRVTIYGTLSPREDGGTLVDTGAPGL